MQVVVETVSNLERQMKVSLPPELISKEIDSRIQKLSRTAKIDGFRTGKIPQHEIKKRFGAGIEFEVLDELMRKTLGEALQQEKIHAAGVSKLEPEQYKSGEAFSYTAILEVYPDIKVQPFSGLSLEKAVATITAEDVERTLESMRKQQTTWEVTERKVEDGDRVTIDFAGSIDGKPFDGGTGKDMAVVIGSNGTIAGFEEGIKGAKLKQALTLKLTFPENYHAKDLAGKPVEFAITVNKIEAPVLPALDDEFAKKFGVTEGISKLREEVQQTLERQLERNLRTKLKNEVLQKLLASYENLEIPKSLIRQESERMAKEMQERFKNFGQGAKAPEFPLNLFEKQAKERVSLGLIMGEIIKQQALKPEAERVRKLIEQMAESYERPEEVVQWYYSNKNRLAEMEYLALEEQVVDKIASDAKVTEKTLSAQEVLNTGETAHGTH